MPRHFDTGVMSTPTTQTRSSQVSHEILQSLCRLDDTPLISHRGQSEMSGDSQSAS